VRKLSTEQRAGVRDAPVGGCAVKATARAHEVFKITVLWLLAGAGYPPAFPKPSPTE
jgi:hypothetical protein